jgi:hypothetical protein
MTLQVDHDIDATDRRVRHSGQMPKDGLPGRDEQPGPGRRPDSVLAPGWPLIAAFAGIPLWWILGLTEIIFFVMAVPMVAHLLRLRSVATPHRFGVWFLFLVWLLFGVLVLQVDAPGAVAGTSMARYFTFAYRFLWYLIGTVAMLYVVNTRTSVHTRRISTALSALFLTLVAGGYLGLLAPSLEFTTAMELLLPRGISSSDFVNSLVHAQAAQVHTFLGGESARPSAPFAYTNTWGLAIALSAPFFVVEWWRRSGAWRISVLPLLIVAAVPIISSLNRALWLSLLVMVAFIAIRFAFAGRLVLLAGLLAAGIGTAVMLWTSPLGDLVSERLANPHSNQGRANLGALSLRSAVEGSPLVGFGTTRDVAGNFSSIAGGASDICPGCSPPPLGTQGHLWLVTFGAGIGGVILFLAFFAASIRRNLNASSPDSIAALCSLSAFLVTLPFYDSGGFGVFVALVAVGILTRERPIQRRPHLEQLVRKVARNSAILGVCVAAGGLLGFVNHATLGSAAQATQQVLVPQADVTGVPGVRPQSLDTEAMLATSTAVVQAIRDEIGAESDLHVRDRLSIAAQPNSRILRLTYVDRDPAVARHAVQAATAEYLALRQRIISSAANSLSTRSIDRLAELETEFAPDATGDASATSELNETRAELLFRAQRGLARITDQAQDPTDPGQSLSEPRVRVSTDALFIRVASGLAMGTLAGVALLQVTDRRRNRLGPKPEAMLAPYDLPIVTRISARAVMERRDNDLLPAQRATATYLPVAGVLADPASTLSVSLADVLEAGLERPADRAGSRVLVVAEEASGFAAIVQLLESCENGGLDPVGMILIVDAGPDRTVAANEQGPQESPRDQRERTTPSTEPGAVVGPWRPPAAEPSATLPRVQPID